MSTMDFQENKYKSYKLLALVFVALSGLALLTRGDNTPGPVTERKCPVSVKIAPPSFDKNDTESTVYKVINSPKFREQSAKKLSKAVQVDTQIGDMWPSPEEDPDRWAQFAKFHKYLRKTFPSVYNTMKVETVHSWGLVFTWEGSDPSLKPSMYTAHQDTVPIQQETIKDWTYTPLSGHYDGEMVYGRGASDCKNSLVALMESAELLIADGFEPERTVLFVFGFDEEASGIQGAAHLGKFLEERYGRDGIYSIIDEGYGTIQQGDKLFGTATVREKGYVDLEVELTTPGGHSSLPPDHTCIGIMSQLANLIESDVYEAELSPENPFMPFLNCQAEHSDDVPDDIKRAIIHANDDPRANSQVVSFVQQDKSTKYLIQTSQSIDIVHGGAKANALPENTKIIVNHRIAIESSVQDVLDRMLGRVLKIASKNDLGVFGFDGAQVVGPTSSGYFNVTIMGGKQLEPSPVSPSQGRIWDTIAGTSRHLYEDLVFPEMEHPLVFAPFVFTANTDTRHYWNLTKHIYRHTPGIVTPDLGKIHSVDERISMDSHLQAVAFFYEFIQSI